MLRINLRRPLLPLCDLMNAAYGFRRQDSLVSGEEQDE